jgi:hypothetical protein
MALNLEQHRSSINVWDQACVAPRDAERWVAAAIGSLLVAAGSGLLWWAAAGAEQRRHRRTRMREKLPTRWSARDQIVGEASEESFPASDAPAWTPTTGNTGPATHWH